MIPLELVYTILGYLGMSLILLAFYLVRTHFKLSIYVNLLAGITMIIWGISICQPPIIILNTIFSLIGIYNLWKLRKDAKSKAK